MRIIVVGAGKVGTALCRSLVDEKHDVILIEEKEEVLKRISKRGTQFFRYLVIRCAANVNGGDTFQ